jgi:gliding motility-associated lipoprotein GldH
MKKNKSYIFLLFASILISSCQREDVVFEQNKPISNFEWGIHDTVSFLVDVDDTLTPNNFYIQFRHTTGYEWKNIYFFVTTQFPNGLSYKDTVWCLLQDNTQWLGQGSGNLVDNTIGIKKNVRFPFKGTYHFHIQHAMYSDPLEEITDVGLKIVKTKQPDGED